MLDGEIVIVTNKGLDFDALQLRLHPAASRVKLLSEQSPRRSCSSICSAMATVTCAISLSKPGGASSNLALSSVTPPIHLTPATTDLDTRVRLVQSIRRRRPRRRDGQADSGNLRAGQARDAQGEARARLRLRRGRFSLAQEGRSRRCRLAAARTVRRCRRPCSTSACARVLRRRSGGNSWNSSRRIVRTRSTIIRGKRGRSTEPATVRPVNACPEARAAGVKARTFRGSRCVPSSSSRSRTITCRATAFVTRRSFGDGGPTRSRRDCTYAQLEVVPPQELAADLLARAR